MPTLPFALPHSVVARLIATLLAGGCFAGGALAADPLAVESELAAPLLCPEKIDAAPLHLAAAVDLALCNNPQTRAAWAYTRAQAGALGMAKAAFLPEVKGSLSSGRQHNDTQGKASSKTTLNSASLGFSWLLYDFGVRDANLANSRELLNAALASQSQTVQAIIFAALQAYYQTHALTAAVDAAQLSEKSASESLAAASARHAAGSATPADRLQAQTAFSQARLLRIKSEGELANARGVLANVLGIDANRLPPLAPLAAPPLAAGAAADSFSQDVATLIEEARRQRPDLLAAEASSNAARASVDAARAAHLPSIAFSAAPAWQNSGGLSAHSSSFGVSVSIPLFSGFEQTYRVARAQALAEREAAERDRLRLQVGLDVWQTYQNLNTARATLHSSADLLAAASESERVALGRYRAGVGNILDLLSAQSALAQARQQSVQASYSWNVARAALAQAIGSLGISTLPALAGNSLARAPGAQP